MEWKVFETELELRLENFYYGRGFKLNETKHNSQLMPFDFVGFTKNKFFCFDAKTTNNLNLFPLSNIKKHQIKNLKEMKKKGCISFILIKYNKLNDIYLLDIDNIDKHTNKSSFTKLDLETWAKKINIKELEKEILDHDK